MLQKLENTYLNILRVFVIITSGLLLIGAILFGLSSLKGFGNGPEHEEFTPKISHETIKEELTFEEKNSDSPQQESSAPPYQQEVIDPNQKYYEGTADAIKEFIATVDDKNSIDQDSAIEILRERAEGYSARLTSAYASGLNEYTNNMFSDVEVIEKARKEGVFNILNKVLDAYTEEFNEQLNQADNRFAQELQEHRQDQANAMTNLYISSGAFGAFLFIVFLSIFIKIERNLRNIKSAV